MSDNVVLIIVIAQSIRLYQIACSVYVIVIAKMYIIVSVCFLSVYDCNCTMYMIGYSHMLFRYEMVRKGAPRANNASDLPPPSPGQLTCNVNRVVEGFLLNTMKVQAMSMRCSTKAKTERRVSKLLNLHFLVPFLTVL
jgi:hypothetical protein